jgi:hypothetical protein
MITVMTVVVATALMAVFQPRIVGFLNEAMDQMGQLGQ